MRMKYVFKLILSRLYRKYVHDYYSVIVIEYYPLKLPFNVLEEGKYPQDVKLIAKRIIWEDREYVHNESIQGTPIKVESS